MNKKNAPSFSRRQFTRRTAMLSAAVVLEPAAAVLPDTGAALQGAASDPQLSRESQLESDSRYQQILGLYSDRLDDEQKGHIQKMCAELQRTLDKIRDYKLQNGDAPALYLKPLVERERKPQPARNKS